MKLDRRNFLKSMTASAAICTLPAGFKAYAAPEDYNGKLLITVQAEGGFDVTSFCDPKTNAPIDWVINNWAEQSDVQQVGNIKYAPVAGNKAFFDKYYKDMLVINGIDAQTNSHTTGVTHNWSGRISAGYPSLTALFANAKAPDLPISYINNGGYAETAGVIRYTRMNNVGQLTEVIYPNRVPWNENETYLHPTDMQRLELAKRARLERLAVEQGMTPAQMSKRSNFKSAIDNSSILKDFANEVRGAGEIEPDVNGGNGQYSSIKRQAQIALLAMKSGVSVAADILQWGFDTHQDHDNLQFWNLQAMTEGIDYIWEYAEQLGLADRLVVVVSSDFGRTPHYNDTNGKDHWPIGSAIVMERDVNWTNRTLGLTDEGHNAIPLRASDFSANTGGEIIYPKHVMYNLRRYLGLDTHSSLSVFPLNDSSAFDFFSV